MSDQNLDSLNLELENEYLKDEGEQDKLNLAEVVYKPPKILNESSTKFAALKADNEDLKQNDPLFLYATAFTADLLIFAAGIGFTWTSPVLPKLKLHGPDNPLGFSVNASQESWIATFLCIGAGVGPLVAGKLADSLGRKKTLICLAFPMLIAFFTLAFTTNLYLYYFARFLNGLSVGSSLAILPMYLGEITENHNRGKYGCIMCIFITSGALYPFVVGPILSIRTFCLTCTFPLFIFLIIFYLFMPDTPHFLLSINDVNGAKEALMALRDKTSSEVEKELEVLSQSIRNESTEKGGIGDLLTVPVLRRGLLVSAGLVIIQQTSGVNAVLGFLQDIFEATGSTMPSTISTVLIGTVQVLTNFLTAVVVEKLGRRILLLASTVGSAASILLLGLYFYLQEHHFDLTILWWFPVACLILYIIAFNIGIGPLPWTIMAEVFPSNVKSIAASLTASICYFTSAGITLAFPILNEILGPAKCFWMFGILLIVGVVFIYFIVPETKGKSLEEILKLLSGETSKV